MPRVPMVEGPSVRDSGLPSARVSGDQPLSSFGGGQPLEDVNNAARGLNNQASAFGGDIADMAVKQKNYADDLRVQDADLATSLLQTDLQNRTKNMLGKNSLDATKMVQEEWDKETGKIRDGLANDQQRFKYDKIRKQRYADIYGSTQNHINTEMRKYDAETTQAYIKNAQNVAQANYSDIKKGGTVDQQLFLQEMAIRKYGERTGEPTQVIDQKVADAKSQTHLAVLSGMLADHNGPVAWDYFSLAKAAKQINMEDQKHVESMFRQENRDLKDTLNQKLIDGELSLGEVEKYSYEQEKGGIGGVEAKSLMKNLASIQATKLSTFRDNNDKADEYIKAVEAVLTGKDEYKAKEILVNAFADGHLDNGTEEMKKINRVVSLLKKKKTSQESDGIFNGFGILKRWYGENETDSKELANAISNYTTYLDSSSGSGGGGGSPQQNAEEIIKQQYNKLYPQAPLGKDDKVFDPKREREISFVPVQRFLKGIARGGAATVEDLGAGLEWIGAKDVGKAFQEWGKVAKDFYQVEDPTYVDQVAEGLGSMTMFFMPGLGLAKGLQAAKVAPSIARWLGVGVSTVLESLTEAGGTYKQAIENGYGDKSASLSATATFWANVPTIALTDRLGVFGDSGPKIMQVLLSGANEAAQEFTQTLIGNIALSDPLNWKDATVSASIGAITGSGIKSAETVTQHLDELGAAQKLMRQLKSERGSVVIPFGGDGQSQNDNTQNNNDQKPIEINPKESDPTDPNNPLNYKTAEEYVASKGNYFRYSNSSDGEGGTPWKMFANDENKVSSGYGKNAFIANEANAVDSVDIENDIVEALEKHPEILDQLQASADIIASEAHPENIVDSAGLWDNADVVQIIWDEVLEPKGITKVRTPDGLIVFDSKDVIPKSQLIREWEAAQKENQNNNDQKPIEIQTTQKQSDAINNASEDSWDQPITPEKAATSLEFSNMTDKELVKEMADLVSQFDPAQTVIDGQDNYSRVPSSWLPGFSEKGYTQKYLQNVYDKYLSGEKLTEKQSSDLLDTLNTFKEMFGIKPSESIPDVVTPEDLKKSKANQKIVEKLGKFLAKPIPASRFKQIIREQTGQTQESKDLLNYLKEKYADQIKAYVLEKEIEEKLAKPLDPSKVKSIVREQTGQNRDQGGQVSERTAFLQSLKDRVKAAAQATKFTKEQIFDTQTALIDLINKSDLEANDKAKFLSTIKNVQTPKDFAKVLKGHTNSKTGKVTPGLEERINNLISKEERRQLIGDIKNTFERAKNSNSIAVDYVNTIEKMIENVDLKNRKPETLQRIQNMKDFLDAKLAKGEDVTVTKEMLNDLKTLEKKRFEDLSNEDLQRLKENIEMAVKLGETKLSAMQSLRESNKQKALELLKKDTVAINSKEIKGKKIGEKLNVVDYFKNKINEAFNLAQEKNIAISPMDVVFDILDGNKNYKGANFKIFKENVDGKYSKYLTRTDKIVESIQKLSRELKLNDESLERIGFYAAKVQHGGVDKLQSMGYTEKEIDAVKLTAAETKLYEAMRTKLDELRPDIQNVMRVAYNKNLDLVEDYFPFMTDFEAMSDKEMRDRFGNNVELVGQQNKKNVNKGFTIKRVGGAQKIKLNALEVFYNHVDNASYLIELGPTIKDLGDIAESEEYAKVAGDVGQETVRSWIDLLARKGGANSRRIKVLDTLRKNVGVATLGFKLSSALVQPTALLDGASIIGHRAFQGSYDIATSREWRQFLRDNFSELRARGADDPAYLEFGGHNLSDKAGRAGFWALRNLDMITASAITAGAYRMAVEEKGGQVDFSNPDKEAITEAQRILRRTQSSAFPKDLPGAISQGGLTGNVSLDKLVLQFQGFMLTRWSLISHDMLAAGIKEKNIPKAMNMFIFLALANFAEIGIRRFSRELIARITDEDIKDWDDTYNKEVVSQMLGNVPFISQIVSSVNYGSIPVPSIDMTSKIIKRLNGAATAKKESTRDRNFVRAITLSAGLLFRIPGTVQGEQLLKGILNDKDRKPVRSAF